MIECVFRAVEHHPWPRAIGQGVRRSQACNIHDRGEPLGIVRLIEGGVSSDDPIEGILANLRYSLRLLAADPQDQVDHFLPPGFPLVAEEMALDFDHWLKAASTDWPLTEDQKDRLMALNHHLDKMGGPVNADLWTRQALSDAHQWSEVRSLAMAALESFGWSFEIPSKQTYRDVQCG